MRDKLHTRLAAIASEQFGIVTTADLRACGLSRQAISRRAAAGHLHPLYRGVYALGHTNISIEGRLLAAVKACGPGAVLSHYAAAAHWGMVTWDDRYPAVTTTRHVRRAGIRTHRSELPRVDVTRHQSIPITTPARTLVDLASVLPFKPLRRATSQARSLRLINLRWVVEALERAGPRKGVANLTRIVATGIPPTRSELEDAVLDLITKGGFAPPDVNVPLQLNGRRVIPDFRWPEHHLVIEADGAEWHDHELARLEAAGAPKLHGQ
jgi:hypothetical protein